MINISCIKYKSLIFTGENSMVKYGTHTLLKGMVNYSDFLEGDLVAFTSILILISFNPIILLRSYYYRNTSTGLLDTSIITYRL